MPPGREEPSARAIDDARSRMMLSFNGLREQLMPGALFVPSNALLHGLQCKSLIPLPTSCCLSAGLKSLLKPKQRWKAVLLLVVACSAILAVTVGIGYASGRSKRAAALQAAGDSQQQQTRAGLLPFPGSTGALQLLSDPNLPGKSSIKGVIICHAAATTAAPLSCMLLRGHDQQPPMKSHPNSPVLRTLNTCRLATGAVHTPGRQHTHHSREHRSPAKAAAARLATHPPSWHATAPAARCSCRPFPGHCQPGVPSSSHSPAPAAPFCL